MALELPITGMTCASCANRIERRLNTLDGVTATVNYATEKATVDFDPEALHLDPPDPQALRQLYTELEFFSLADEIKNEAGPGAVEDVPQAEELTSPEAWTEKAGEMRGDLYVAVLGEEPPLGLSASCADPGTIGTTGTVYFADFRRR